jgi:hypothetical protein
MKEKEREDARVVFERQNIKNNSQPVSFSLDPEIFLVAPSLLLDHTSLF